MSEQLPFDSGPDAGLGDRLRAALDTADGEAFLARLRHGVAAVGGEDSLEVLARWAPRGMIAAAAAAVIIWLTAPPHQASVPTVPVASAPVQMEVVPGQPEAAVLTVAILEGR